MGKNLIQQRRGRGSFRYKVFKKGLKGAVKYPQAELQGELVELLTSRLHSAVLGRVHFDDGSVGLMIAPERVRVGDRITIGKDAEVRQGNTLSLGDIPEGTLVYNIELKPGDGGKLVRASGAFARVSAKTGGVVTVILPSKKRKVLDPRCRASVGVVSGSGRLEKPMMKAGRKYFAKKAKNKLYPKVSGTSMNSLDHPFGGSSSHHHGKSTIAPKNAPAGRKVGKLRPRRTGQKKGKSVVKGN